MLFFFSFSFQSSVFIHVLQPALILRWVFEDGLHGFANKHAPPPLKPPTLKWQRNAGSSNICRRANSGKKQTNKKIPKASRDGKTEISDWKDAVLNVFLCRRAGKKRHGGDAEKRFTFTCSNNVIMGININVLCFMLKCDTHVVASFWVTSSIPFVLRGRHVCYI